MNVIRAHSMGSPMPRGTRHTGWSSINRAVNQAVEGFDLLTRVTSHYHRRATWTSTVPG
jgi:hypothetical protein